MRFCGIAMTLEAQPGPERGAGAEPAHDSPDSSAFPVVFCSLQQRPIALSEVFRDWN